MEEIEDPLETGTLAVDSAYMILTCQKDDALLPDEGDAR